MNRRPAARRAFFLEISMAGLDLSSPVVQHLIKSNPVLAQQLGLTTPLVPPPPAGAVTMQQVQDAISARLGVSAAPTPADAPVARLAAWVGKIDAMLQRALPAEDFADLKVYADAGAPGFAALLEGEALYPLAQLLWETIRESQK
jgi:hypothetical protein